MKSLFGIILVALGVTVICTGIGQSKASDTTATILDGNFDTIAVLSGESILSQDLIYESLSLPTLDMSKSEDAARWAAEAMIAHPDVIGSLSQNGLASAYIRDVQPVSYYTDGYTWDHIYHHTYDKVSDIITNVAESPQCHAMFEITLDEIGTHV